MLIATGNGAYLDGTSFESLLAAALRARGQAVNVLLCDRALPACLECSVDRIGRAERLINGSFRNLLCRGCTAAGVRTFGPVADIGYYGDYLSDQDRVDARHLAQTADLRSIEDLVVDGLPVGEHAYAGTLRFFARADLEGEDLGEEVLRRFLEAGALAAVAAERAFDDLEPDVVVLHHGIYVPQGVIAAVARARGIRVVTWNPAYRSGRFIFSHEDTYHRTLLNEPPETWQGFEWTDALSLELQAYLSSRAIGTQDWIHFVSNPEDDLDRIAAETGIDFTRPVIGMLTNVMWDAQLLYPQNAFPNMRSWVVETIRWFADHPDLQLLIRVHPAEIRGNIPSRQPILDEVSRSVGALPGNVKVIPPSSQLSTYAAMSACDSVLIYATKTGVELSAMGIPVVVAGEAWARNKGITIDVSSRDGYFRVLDGLPILERLDEKQRLLAERYAFHFFFRRMIPVRSVSPTGFEPKFLPNVEDMDQLRAGLDRGLDIICDGILEGSPFIYPEEEIDREAAERVSGSVVPGP